MSEPVAIQASAGTDAMSEAIIQSTVPKGAVITQQPILGEPDKTHTPAAEPEKPKQVIADTEKPNFFPANPTMTDQLADNKPVKQLNKEGSGGIFRTISDVLVELRGKHQDKKRARQQAVEEGAQAKVRKETPASPANSPTQRQPSSPLKSFFSLGSPKRSGSGADSGDDKVRAACWGPNGQAGSQATKEKKPSLAQRYSAWKAVQSEKKGAKASKASTKKAEAAASSKGAVAVSSDATSSKPAAAATPATPAAAAAPTATTEPVVVSSDATPAEATEVVSKDAVHGQSS